MSKLRQIAALTAVFLTAAGAAGCAASQPGSRPHPRPVILTASQVATLRAYADGDTAFGLSVLGKLCRQSPGSNVALSPVSLATGLGMASLGARGAAQAAMARVLHLPARGPALINGLRARWALLGSLNRPGVVFAASNRIWADPSLATKARFTAELRAGYQASLRHVPLLTQPEQARRAINASVAADTGGHISKLLPPGSLSQIGWILTDALYLHAAWAHPFNRAMTNSAPFATGTGSVTARYLHGSGFATAAAGGWTAASLPYRGGRLAMLALLPPASGPAGCRLPGPATLGRITARIAAGGRTTAIALPKISLASSNSMRGVLSALGMGIAFTRRADFTGISRQACCIGFVQHAATLTVTEKGTVASAATAVGIQPQMLLLTLRFDRPYLLLIRDTVTGEPLMAAWVANPAQS